MRSTHKHGLEYSCGPWQRSCTAATGSRLSLLSVSVHRSSLLAPQRTEYSPSRNGPCRRCVEEQPVGAFFGRSRQLDGPFGAFTLDKTWGVVSKSPPVFKSVLSGMISKTYSKASPSGSARQSRPAIGSSGFHADILVRGLDRSA